MNYFSCRRCIHYRNDRLICLSVACVNVIQWPPNMAQVAVSGGKLQKKAVYLEMKDYIAKNFSFNVNAMFDEALSSTYVNFTEGEKKHFYDKYVKTINTRIGNDGKLELVLKDI